MIARTSVTSAFLALIVTALPFGTDAEATYHERTEPPAAVVQMVEGEVRKIDKSAGKLTIKHAPITNLDMPAMTMVFRVNDPVMLTQVKPGDKIKFAAEKINGALTVMKVEPVK